MKLPSPSAQTSLPLRACWRCRYPSPSNQCPECGATLHPPPLPARFNAAPFLALLALALAPLYLVFAFAWITPWLARQVGANISPFPTSADPAWRQVRDIVGQLYMLALPILAAILLTLTLRAQHLRWQRDQRAPAAARLYFAALVTTLCFAATWFFGFLLLAIG